MRKDMFKVIVERPRKKGYGTKKGRYDEDEPCNWEKIRPVGRKADRKVKSENLNPLWRFLRSRVGQSWDKVYSEIRANLSSHSTLHIDVVKHLKWGVCTNTYIGPDGHVYGYDVYGGFPRNLVVGNSRYNRKIEFYVHPVTRQLCARVRKPKKKAAAAKENNASVNFDVFVSSLPLA